MHVLYIHAQQGMATPPYPLYHLKRQLIKKCELIKKQFKIEQFNIGKADHSTFKTQHPKFMLLCSPSQYRSALMPPLGWGYNKKSFDIWKQTFNQFIHVCNRFFPRCSIVCFIISNSFSSIISFCNPSPSSIWINREQQFEYIIGYYL